MVKVDGTGARASAKEAVRTRILDALLGLMADGQEINHDLVAERAGIARRTVYRYFPDRDALMKAAWQRITEIGGPRVGFPHSEEQYLADMPAIFRGFDGMVDTMILLRSTPQGRAVRLSQRAERTAAYSAAFADVTAALAKGDRRLAVAMLQMLHTTPWLELRDQWGLTAEEIAIACGWAARVLLADIRRRGKTPLAAGPASG